MPRITVVIVAYNSAHDLGDLLPLLDDPRIETIVVDNASADGSMAVVEAHAHCSGIEMGVNAGWTAGSNVGAERATGSVLAFVNPDVRVRPDDLVRLADALGPRVASTSPMFQSLDGTLHPFAFRFPDPVTGLFVFFNAGQRIDAWLGSPFVRRRAYQGKWAAREIDCVGAACMVVDADVFRSVGSFDERMWLFFSDTDWAQRAHRAGLRHSVVSDVIVLHEGGGSVKKLPTRMLATAFQRDYLRYAELHYGFAGRLITRVGLLLLVGALPAMAALARGQWGMARECLAQAREVRR